MLKYNTTCIRVWTADNIQWNLGITDTQGTVLNSEVHGLISHVYFYVLNRPRD